MSYRKYITFKIKILTFILFNRFCISMDGAGIVVPSSEDESNAPGTAYADLRVVQVINPFKKCHIAALKFYWLISF